MNYREANRALSTVTLDTPNNQYDYPLVTVEISTGMFILYCIACFIIHVQVLLIELNSACIA